MVTRINPAPDAIPTSVLDSLLSDVYINVPCREMGQQDTSGPSVALHSALVNQTVDEGS